MYLPRSATGLFPESSLGHTIHTAGNNAPTTNGWSSLIGIVTAICGNVLISFALNAQRYAHIRLSRDRQQWAEKQKAGRRRRSKRRTTYGTQQETIAEERAEENAKAEPEEGAYTLEEAEESNETQPLIPRVEPRRTGSLEEQDEDDDGDDDGDAPQDKTYLKSPIWWLGISLMVVGEAGNFLAYGFAPASIVSPLGVVALVSNCLIAPLLLGERFRWRDGLGVLIAIAGCVTVVLSASDSNPRLDPDKIWALISQWEFETYFGITVFLIIALVVASNKFGDRTVLIDLGLVALFGGYTALSTKGIASLLSNTIWRVVTFPITYLLLAVLIFTAVMQIKYVNRALQHFNATIVIPTQFVLFTISVIVGSAILYRDFEREEAGDAVKFFGGCALTFLGVWCITSGRKDDENEGESGDEEDAIDLVDEEHMQPEIREREDDHGRRRSIIAGSSKTSPELQRLRTADSVPPSVIVTPDLPPSAGLHASVLELDRSPLDAVPPANASAIHSSSMTQLPQGSNTDPQKPPQLHATTSAPIVPQTLSNTSPLRPRTPLNRNKSGPATDSPTRGYPSTPLNRTRSQQTQYLDPANASQPRQQQHRHSMVGLLPGPLTSPLSTSLSAIVADSLRRGVDNPASTLKRRPSRNPRYESSSKRTPTAAALKRHSIASGEMDFGDEETADLRAGAGSPQGRVRSLSATLGEMFGSSSATPKRQRLESWESVLETPEEHE